MPAHSDFFPSSDGFDDVSEGRLTALIPSDVLTIKTKRSRSSAVVLEPSAEHSPDRDSILLEAWLFTNLDPEVYASLFRIMMYRDPAGIATAALAQNVARFLSKPENVALVTQPISNISKEDGDIVPPPEPKPISKRKKTVDRSEPDGF